VLPSPLSGAQVLRPVLLPRLKAEVGEGPAAKEGDHSSRYDQNPLSYAFAQHLRATLCPSLPLLPRPSLCPLSAPLCPSLPLAPCGAGGDERSVKVFERHGGPCSSSEREAALLLACCDMQVGMSAMQKSVPPALLLPEGHRR